MAWKNKVVFRLSPQGREILLSELQQQPSASTIFQPTELRRCYFPDAGTKNFALHIVFRDSGSPGKLVVDAPGGPPLAIPIGETVKPEKTITLSTVTGAGAITSNPDGYILKTGGCLRASVRLKERGDHSKAVLRMRFNSDQTDLSGVYEYRIPAESAQALFDSSISLPRVEKTRYYLDGFRIDVFPDGEILAERDFLDMSDIDDQVEAQRNFIRAGQRRYAWLVGAEYVPGLKSRSIANNRFPRPPAAEKDTAATPIPAIAQA